MWYFNVISAIALTILIVIIAAIILFSVLRSALRATLSLIFLVFIALIVLGFLFVQDVNSFKNTFISEPSLYVLEDNGELITSFSMVSLNISSFKPVSLSKASDIVLDEGPGKVFLMNKTILDLSVDDEVHNLTGLGFDEAFSSSHNEVRASAFLIAVLSTQREQGNMYFVKQTRNGNVAILPQSFAINVLTFNSNDYLVKIKTIINNQKDGFIDIVNESKQIINSTI